MAGDAATTFSPARPETALRSAPAADAAPLPDPVADAVPRPGPLAEHGMPASAWPVW